VWVTTRFDIQIAKQNNLRRVNMDNTYGCDMCGERKDWEREIIWITSTYGVCVECFATLSEDELEELRRIYE